MHHRLTVLDGASAGRADSPGQAGWSVLCPPTAPESRPGGPAIRVCCRLPYRGPRRARSVPGMSLSGPAQPGPASPAHWPAEPGRPAVWPSPRESSRAESGRASLRARAVSRIRAPRWRACARGADAGAGRTSHFWVIFFHFLVFSRNFWSSTRAVQSRLVPCSGRRGPAEFG